MRARQKRGMHFYRILCTLLFLVILTGALSVALVVYLRNSIIDAHVETLSNSMRSGAQRMDDMFSGAYVLYGQLCRDSYLKWLLKPQGLSLWQQNAAQGAIKEKLAAYRTEAEYASEAFLYLYGHDSMITVDGMTAVRTFFINRFSGEVDDFVDLISEPYRFSIVTWPFEASANGSEWFVDTALSIAHTVYVDGTAVGTLVITLDRERLPDVLSRYLIVPDSRADLLLNGASICTTPIDADFSTLPEGDYSGYLAGVGIVVRRASLIVPSLSYLVVEPESAIMPVLTRSFTFSVIALALITAALSCFAYFASRRLYTPVKLLLGEMRTAGEVDSRTDEAQLLLSSIRGIHTENADIKNALSSSAPLVRDALLYHLLSFGGEDDRALMDQYLPAVDGSGRFYVFVVVAFLDSGDDGRVFDRNGPIMSALLCDVESQVISAVKTSEIEYAVVTYPMDSDARARFGKSISEGCDEINGQSGETRVVVAAGRGVSHIDRISVCFLEARALIDERPIDALGLLPEGADGAAAPNVSDALAQRLPADLFDTVAGLIKDGVEATAWAYMRAILDRALKDGVSARAYARLCYLLNLAIERALSQSPTAARDAERIIEIDPDAARIRPEPLNAILLDNLNIALRAGGESDAGDLNRVLRYIDSEFASGVNLASTAAHFGYNANYFSRFFKQRTGMNFTEYLNRRKIECACRLLRDERISVREAGVKSGFNGTGQFISTFVRLIGTTPGSYRKCAAPDETN